MSECLPAALEAWRDYARARQRLRDMKYCRSCKDPEAEFAEWLVEELVGGQRVEDRSGRGCDVAIGSRRIQVKKWGRNPGNKARMPPSSGSLLPETDPNCPTEFAFVEYLEGIPTTIYLADYRWVTENAAPSGLRFGRVKEASAGGDAGVRVYPVAVEPGDSSQALDELPGAVSLRRSAGRKPADKAPSRRVARYYANSDARQQSVDDDLERTEREVRSSFPGVRVQFATQTFTNHVELWVNVLDLEQCEAVRTKCEAIAKRDGFEEDDPEIWILVRPWRGEWPGGEGEAELRHQRREEFRRQHGIPSRG